MLTAGRSDQRKLTRPEVLRQMRKRYRLLRPAAADVFDLDLSQLTADDAAARILKLLGSA